MVEYKLPQFMLVRVALLVAIITGSASSQCLAKKQEKSKTQPNTSKKIAVDSADDFPLTNLKLAKKPVDRWAFGLFPLNPKFVEGDPFTYLAILEKNLAKVDLDRGLQIDDDKRMEVTLQYFIQKLLAKNKTVEAKKLEHRLARIQSKHPNWTVPAQ